VREIKQRVFLLHCVKFFYPKVSLIYAKQYHTIWLRAENGFRADGTCTSLMWLQISLQNQNTRWRTLFLSIVRCGDSLFERLGSVIGAVVLIQGAVATGCPFRPFIMQKLSRDTTQPSPRLSRIMRVSCVSVYYPIY
jgi:hypothetical protein